MKNLAGKYCIVTGAGKGIGKAIAARFIEEQAAGVAILEWDLTTAEATAKELDPTGERVIAIKCNVADSDMAKAAVEEVVAKFGRIDVLVNNAGVTRDKIFHKMTDDDWNTVININLNGVYNLCKNVVPVMREQEAGSIINITSTSIMGNPGQANYAASKAAMEGFTRTMAKELGRKNIRMNCIAPGYIDTDMMRAVGEEILTRMIKGIPAQRLGKPEEIASVAAFLASDDASWLSGENIFVSGAGVMH
ncbi:MAG: 3-oxoacyl-ACP reductase FabG [Ruminococcaceae bacterium]|nr:3-oxoacyl-ACP reductase FabG [Oscillospiraceae bacterium]